MRISDWSSDVCSSDLFNYIRGFESVLYVDGLKRNYGFVYMPRPEIATLDRVEVLVGPASVLYGAGSSGGLPNMQRSQECLVGKECVSTCRSRWTPYH